MDKARLLHDGPALNIDQRDNQWLIYVPESQRDSMDTVIVLS